VILDGGRQFCTGCSVEDIVGAQRALADHINRKHVEAARSGPKPTTQIPVVDVLTLYVRDVVPTHRNPKRAAFAVRRLGEFFRGKFLSDINGSMCRDYSAAQPSSTTAGRDLEFLRASINHHRQEGLHDRIVSVVTPSRRPPRERWLTRDEAAKILWNAYKFQRKAEDRWRSIERFPRRHYARFILVALYTGSRAQVISQASFVREPGRPYIDLQRGMFYRRAEGDAETNKRRPTIPLPPELLEHLRRWQRLGARYVVEWNGRPVRWLNKVFNAVVVDAGLDGRVTPHTLRHTSATWYMQAGTDMWVAAGYLGMTVQTLERVYGHHHPNRLEGVKGAFRKLVANG
ncbi:MAG: site-specific integrase, partial [Xanthobacteraceae bacterium]